MATPSFQPNTGTQLNEGRTNSGLSTQIVIKINNNAVGALQTLTVAQNRPLARIQEIGTDGTIEIVPQGATTYELTAGRIVFDQLRLPEAFSRAFRFIAAQRIPFDIDIIDMSSMTSPGTLLDNTNSGAIVMTYKNCWFQRYDTPYAAENYLITETATIWAETAYISNDVRNFSGAGVRGYPTETDNATGSVSIEQSVNGGNRRGAMDASGLFNSLLKT